VRQTAERKAFRCSTLAQPFFDFLPFFSIKRAGTADLALMGGAIPPWLYERMVRLAGPLVEAIVLNEGTQGFLSRLSDPFWFQSFGAVIGMDWNSSGVTTSMS